MHPCFFRVPVEDRSVGRESWDFPASWQEAFPSIPALLHMPERVGHVFFFFFPLSIIKMNILKAVEELAFTHSVSRKALQTAQLGVHQASRGHGLLLQLWGTSKKGGPDLSPFLVQPLRYMLASSLKSSDRVTLRGARSVC